jgi:hypothetical protein
MATYDKGKAPTDVTIINERFSTVTAAGSAVNLTSDYTYNQLYEIRADISDWTGIADNFTGAYLRFSSSQKTTSYNLTGMELNVASTTAVVQLSGLYSETQCKTLTASSTWTKVKGVEANLSFYNQSQTVGVTEAMCFYATIGLGSGYTAYTGIHGIVIETRDGSTGTRTLGSGIVMRNIYPAEGTQTFTKGLQMAMACVTGISLEGAMTTGVSITGAATNVIVAGTVGTGTDGWLLKAGTSGTPLVSTAAGGAVHIYNNLSATSGTHRTMIVDTKLTGTTNSSGFYTIRGHAQLGATEIDGGAYVAGVQGKLTFGTSTLTHADARYAAVLAQLDMSGAATYTDGQVMGLWVDAGASSGMTMNGAQFYMLRITNTTSNIPDSVIDVHSEGSLFMQLTGPGGNANWFDTRGTPANTAVCDGYLKTSVGGKTLYIPLYNAVTIS